LDKSSENDSVLKKFAALTGTKMEVKPTDDTVFLSNSQLKSSIMGTGMTFAIPCSIIKPRQVVRLNCKQKIANTPVNEGSVIVACPMCTNKVIGTFKYSNES